MDTLRSPGYWDCASRLATAITNTCSSSSKSSNYRISSVMKRNMKSIVVCVLFLNLFACLVPKVGALSNVGCPHECTCDDSKFVVECEKTKLTVIPITLNPSIRRLVLKGNKIKTIDSSFQFYKDLQYVELSSNHLVNIPSRSFMYQEKLQEFHLNDNKLSAINDHTFQGLKSLRVLNLRMNFVEELTKGLFKILPKLEELNLGKNSISKIDPQAFEGLLSLRVLYLDNNQLSVVPTPSFQLLGGLAELHVGLNGFTSLPDDSFQGLSRLTVLDVSSAGLTNITNNSFRGLTGLRILNLADNKLTDIPTAQLSQLNRLEELTIGQNDFSIVRKNAFKGLTNLRKIDITGAHILEKIEREAFENNLNLETIALVSNKKLEGLENGALVGLPNLRHLNLRENSFKTLSESLASWNELKLLELTDNPLNCDCQLLWLLNSLNTRNITNVQCFSPLQLRDKNLRTLTADDLGCSFGDPRRQAIIITFCVSAIILLGVLGLFLFRYRQRVREALKDYKWNKRAISRKEHEYQKTFSEDDYITRSVGQHQLHIKPIPVTEL